MHCRGIVKGIVSQVRGIVKGIVSQDFRGLQIMRMDTAEGMLHFIFIFLYMFSLSILSSVKLLLFHLTQIYIYILAISHSTITQFGSVPSL